MKKAAMVVGSHVWTMTYEIKDEKINILDFNKDDSEGYTHGQLLAHLQSIRESDGRIAESVTIDNVEYEVLNKQNIFTYKQPL